MSYPPSYRGIPPEHSSHTDTPTSSWPHSCLAQQLQLNYLSPAPIIATTLANPLLVTHSTSPVPRHGSTTCPSLITSHMLFIFSPPPRPSIPPGCPLAKPPKKWRGGRLKSASGAVSVPRPRFLPSPAPIPALRGPCREPQPPAWPVRLFSALHPLSSADVPSSPELALRPRSPSPDAVRAILGRGEEEEGAPSCSCCCFPGWSGQDGIGHHAYLSLGRAAFLLLLAVTVGQGGRPRAYRSPYER